MDRDRHGGAAAARPRRWHVLLPGLFGCLLLGLFLVPAPFYQGGQGGSGLEGAGLSGGGSSAHAADEDLLLRGKHTQRSRDTAQASESLLRYFAEAHGKGQMSASALQEVEYVLQQQQQRQRAPPPLELPVAQATATAAADGNPYTAVQEELYWQGRDRREAQLASIHHNMSAIRPFDKWGPIYIWDWFNPDYVCPTMERVGRLGDGGKWMCGLETLRQRPVAAHRPCIVYAFGVNDDTSFEEELANRTHCQIFAFDPTVANLPASAANVTPPLHFHKQALGPKDGASRRFLLERNLLSIMKELGHTYIDVLKVDVEGAEWASFAPVFAAGPLPVGQLLIELHYKDVATTFDFFSHLEAAGFRIFSRETNYHPCVTGKMPVAIEYSFIQPDTYPKGLPSPQSKKMLAALPPYQRHNGVIYMLTQRARIHKHLLNMLKGLDRYFNAEPGRAYPVIIFHDDFTAEDEAIVQAATSSPILFHRVEFEIPSFLDKSRIPERCECSTHSSTVGYRHMCRFLGLQVQHLLKEYEWHWRLDDDSVFLAPIGYDPFRLMADNGKRYAFNRILHDNVNCVVGLWDVAKDFAKARGISPTFLDNWDSGVTFYNNFEISHRSIWEDPMVQAFMDHVDALGGIYYVRWGDAPIRSLAVAMAVPETEVHFFSDVGYAHLPYHRHEPRPLPPPSQGALWHLDGAFQYVRDVDEDKKLQKMGALSRRRQHGVIVIFSTSERFEVLKKCLRTLDARFNKHRGYPIWVWSHGLTYTQRLELRALSTAPLRVDTMDRALHLTQPAGAAKGPCGPRDVESTRLLGWEVSRIIAARYEWQWRLTDDAVFLEDVAEDPFLTMVQAKATYGMAAVRPVPAADRACVRTLVDAATTRLALGEEESAEVLDTVESAYFDPNFEISHRNLWEDPRWDELVDVVENGGLVHTAPFVGHVDEAYIRSLGVALHLQGGEGALHIFSNLNSVDLSASLVPWSKGEPTADVLATRIHGHGVEVSHDATVVSKLFRPQRLGFLGAELAAPVSLPKGQHVSGDAFASSSSSLPEMVWMLGKTQIGHLNNTKPVAAFGLEDAAALLSPSDDTVDYFWRHAQSQRMPASILNDGTLGNDQALFPTAGLAVVPEKHPDEVRLVLLCQLRNVSEFVYEGQWTQLGSAVVVVANARLSPSRWVYEVRRIPGSGVWSGWHTALALADGKAVSRTPAADNVYMMGEQTTNVTTATSWHLKREHVLARVPLASLLKLSVDKMEIFAASGGASQGHWEPYSTVLQPSEGSQEGAADRVRQHTQTLFPSADGKAKALVTERVGLGYLPGPKLWYMADVVPLAAEEEEEGKRLVLKTATEATGPWQDHAILRLPAAYATPQYVCPSLYVLPTLARDKEWEAALGLACLVKGHGARPVEEGKSQLSAQVGPTAVGVLRVRFGQGAGTEVEVAPVPTH